MSAAATIALLRRARELLVTRGHCKGSPMRTADGAYAPRPALAASFSVTGALMAAAEEQGAPWGVDKGDADNAVRALHIAIKGDGASRARAYIEVADANDALPEAEAKARAVAWMTESIGIVNSSKRPRAVRRGDAA